MRTLPPADGRPVLLYDGLCPLCTRQAALLARLGRGRARLLPLQEAVPGFPGLSEEDALREVKLVDDGGRIYGGAEAVVRLARLERPLLSLPLLLYYLPGVRFLADRLYRRVAWNRYRLLGGAACSGACRSFGPEPPR